jgi:hypothetical protein
VQHDEELELRKKFIAVKPDEVSKNRLARNSELAFAYSKFLHDQVPPSRERSLALTAIEEAAMWASKAVLQSQKQESGVWENPDS